jgi:hypothetical protein
LSDTLSVSIDTNKDVAHPTLEEEAAKLDAGTTAATGDTSKDRPAWLPEKFKSEEDFAKAYTELEKKLGGKSDTETEPKDDEELVEKPAGDQTEARKVADEAATKAGLDLNELSASYWENGSLSDDQYAKLEKAGYPKTLVDQFTAGQQAILDQRSASVYAEVGGEDSYGEMLEWAGDNLDSKQIAAFNKTVNGTDMSAIMLAVKGLKAQYDGSVGFEPSTAVQGHTSARTGAAKYDSIAQMEKDMSDPRYGSDPAFRKSVEDKLSRSSIF